MTPKLLRRRIAERDGLCEVWLVYEEKRSQTIATGEFRARLVRAFWSRVEATGWARTAHAADTALHYHVYRLVADEAWAAENSLRSVQHVASFDAAGERPLLSVTVGAVAHALG